jgi:hypothetical protein
MMAVSEVPDSSRLLEWEKERGRGVCFPAPHCFAADDFLGNNPDPEEIFGFTRYRDFR